MERVETNESEKIVRQIENLKNDLFMVGNKWIMNESERGIYVNYSNSTRSIYVTVRNHQTWDEKSMRISDHASSTKRNPKDVEINFSEFSLQSLIEFYKSI